MSLESDFILSFYREVSIIDQAHQVLLVQHTETKKFYVKKTVSSYNKEIYLTLKEENFPHIPLISQLIEDGGRLIVIEEYINGCSVEELLREKLFTEAETRKIAAELCQILHPLHRHRPAIVHRDIKPSNLIVDNRGQLYLIDFDASKRYDPKKKRDTVLMGTTDYAAPEQYGFLQSDQRTDIYSIGILMNKMLTGRLPAQEEYRGPLAPMIEKCTAIDPADRYQTASALQKDIERKSCSLTPPGFRTRRPVRMILALCWYIMLPSLAFTLEVEEEDGVPMTGALLWANRAGVFAALLLWTLYLTNYIGFRDRFPARRCENPLLNLLRILAGMLLLLFIPAALTVCLESLLG